GHYTGLQPNKIEQVVDQFEQTHAIGMHRDQQISALLVERTLETIQKRLQRREQQGERGAQLVADIREESAFHFIHFPQLLIRFFEDLFVLVQLEAQGEFTKSKAVKEIIYCE